jgi:uncharacterized protein (DUF983 family)
MAITAGEAISRGLRKRCPNCGQGKVFSSFFKLNTRCAVCGFRFEREPGYWTGAIAVNIAFVEMWVAILILGTVIATQPDVPWTTVWIVGLATNAILPFLLLPYSRTLWMGLHLHYDPTVRRDNQQD